MTTTFTKEVGRWSDEMTRRMADVYGVDDFDRLISARVVALMCGYAGRRGDAPKEAKPDMVKINAVASAICLTRRTVIDRINTIVQTAVHGNCGSDARTARRIVIKEYALRGARTAEDIRQADKAAASPQPTQPKQLPLPAPAARTLDVIAVELREAKREQVRAEVAASVACSRVEALRAELRAAVDEV